jgi:diaminohydroxyphosphoribosylaminopyrimidine deaminase/5-amino-6-(5-phosphoribosylamino)uracil reductase
LIQAGIKRVFVAMLDPNPIVSGQGVAKLIRAGIDVTVGILEQQAEALNPGFCMRMTSQRPYVRSKIAMSLDGRTAMSTGESKWITGADARHDVQKMRARSSAILTGIGTILADDPALTVRPEGADWYPKGEVRQPAIVVVDSQGQIAHDAKVFDSNREIIIATTVGSSLPELATVMMLPNDHGQVDLALLLTKLAEQGINELMIEAGPVLNGALLSAGLIDEIVIYMAPKLMGDGARGLFHLPEIINMEQSIDLEINEISQVGKDWRITAKPHYEKVN